MPRVSVIIPTYSRPQLLPRAVESARQAAADLEILIVDDASTGDTARVARELASQNKDVRHIRLERNQGVAGARNVGLMASKSEFIAFLDDDDLRLPGSIDFQIKALAAMPEAGLACGAIYAGDQDCRPTETVHQSRLQSGDLFWEMVVLHMPILPISVVLRRECFLKVGLFNPHLAGIDDWDMWTRVSEIYPLVVSREPVCIYRDPLPHTGQGSSDMARHIYRASRHQLRLLQLPRARAASAMQRRRARKRYLEIAATSLLIHARRCAAAGAYDHARASVLMSMRLDPLRVIMRRRPASAQTYGNMILKSLRFGFGARRINEDTP